MRRPHLSAGREVRGEDAAEVVVREVDHVPEDREPRRRREAEGLRVRPGLGVFFVRPGETDLSLQKANSVATSILYIQYWEINQI